ncbi:MAG: DUF72 domain-containing protein [Myxococcota bacterium]
MQTSVPKLRLGCPIWACAEWRGNLFEEKTPPKDFLRQYAEVFDCVEGNSTFYALPAADTVDRWRDETPSTFRFCFKFPKTITHERRLVDAQRQTEAFFERMGRLSERLGPFLIQLPPTFGPERLDALDAFLSDLPRDHTYAVEVRHPSLFTTDAEALSAILDAHGVARGLMDTRAVHAARTLDPTTLRSQSRKPKVPWCQTVNADTPFVRVVGQNDVQSTSGYLDQWAKITAAWLQRGWSPFVFLHAPDDYYAPRLARAFHYLVRKRQTTLAPHPTWPGEKPAPKSSQLGLL